MWSGCKAYKGLSFAILRLLMENPKQTVTKSVLLDRISEDTPDCMESSLRVHISNLRRNCVSRPGRIYIEAVWGIGFRNDRRVNLYTFFAILLTAFLTPAR